jgi:hypothetical protein
MTKSGCEPEAGAHGDMDILFWCQTVVSLADQGGLCHDAMIV